MIVGGSGRGKIINTHVTITVKIPNMFKFHVIFISILLFQSPRAMVNILKSGTSREAGSFPTRDETELGPTHVTIFLPGWDTHVLFHRF